MKLTLLLATATLLLTACGNTGSADSSSQDSVRSNLYLDQIKAAQAAAPVLSTNPATNTQAVDCVSAAANTALSNDLMSTLQTIFQDVQNQSANGNVDVQALQDEIQNALGDIISQLETCLQGVGSAGAGVGTGATGLGNNLGNGANGVNVGNGTGFNFSNFGI